MAPALLVTSIVAICVLWRLVRRLQRRAAELTRDLERANAALAAERQAAEEADRERDEHLAKLAHDLRSPLSAVINFTEFLGRERSGPLTERQRDMQRRVLTSAENLLGLINERVDPSKGGARAGGFGFEAPALQAPVVRAPAGLAVDQPGGDPLVVVVDDDPKSSAMIAGCLTSAGYRVIQVADSSRALSIIRTEAPALVIFDLVMLSVGGLEVLNTLRESELTRELPVLVCSFSSQDEVAITFGANEYLNKPLVPLSLLGAVRRWTAPGAQILVVDDDQNTREILRMILEPAGYQIWEADDGAATLDLLERYVPSLIILDVVLPGMDGFSLLERIRANPALEHIPVLVVTARVLTAKERIWLSQRGTSFYGRPVGVEQFLARVAQLAPLPAAAG
jgi:CheY-like chemotaxis protein